MAQRFYGGQNSNDFSEWTTEDTSATKRMQLSAGSALGGTAFGILVDPSGATHKEVTYNVGITSTRGTHRLACRVNKNTLVMTAFGVQDIVVLTSDGSTETRILELSFYEDSGAIKARATVLDDNSVNIDVSDTSTLPAGDVTLEAELVYASGASANDGTLELFVNGVSVASRADVDIFVSEVGAFGARVLTVTDGGYSSGTYYLDEIYYRDDSTPIYPPGTFTHLWLSTDGGATYTNIGDSAWGSNVVGGVVVVPGTAYQTIFAAVGTNLYKTVNGGGAWTLEVAITYEVDFISLEKDNATVFMAKRDAAGTNRASLWDSVGASLTHINTGKSTTGGATSGGDVV